LKKNKTSKNWIIKQHRDPYFKKSKIEGYRSRSAYKLIEIEKKFKFFRKKMNLIDLGSCPGGWSQVSRKKIIKGKVLAIDIKKMDEIENVNFLKKDLRNEEIYNIILQIFSNQKVDAVISDMAANTTGNKDLDSIQTGELCLIAMNLAIRVLNKNGVFISKLFMSASYNEININAKQNFKKVVIFKPQSSKKESREIYIYCKGPKININNS
jgi:23S rRNA (uridine2552-2'-O)-methyltransferase